MSFAANCNWRRGNSSKLPTVRSYPEAASQSATKKGQLVYLVNGLVTVTPTSAGTAGKVWGILNQDCTGVTGSVGTDTLEVTCIESGDLIEMTYSGVAPIQGLAYGITIAAVAGKSQLLTSDNTNGILTVQRVVNTTTKRVEVIIKDTALQVVTGS